MTKTVKAIWLILLIAAFACSNSSNSIIDVSSEGNQIETPVNENEPDSNPKPTFLANQDPKPSGKKWVSVDGNS
ncbi:MAG: hypothetical protein ACSHWV_04270 [Cellulophaga fucicola]